MTIIKTWRYSVKEKTKMINYEDGGIQNRPDQSIV